MVVNSSLGKVGRLDVDTGDVTNGIHQWTHSHPYSMTVINDIVWYNESGMRPDALVRFDPATEQFQLGSALRYWHYRHTGDTRW